MSLPSEYIIKEALRSIDDVIIYRAEHPIHELVNVYLPDEALSPEMAVSVKRRLYKSGRQMRNISLLNIPFITKTLEVSQNPNQPYIVTKLAKHDIEELISNGVTLPPKRVFAIISQVLQATVSLASNEWVLNYFYPRQIKLSDLHTGDISLTLIEGPEQQITVTKTVAALQNDKSQEDNDNSPPTAARPGEEKKDSQDKIDFTSTFQDSGGKQSRIKERNIYLLGNIAYQLLFGRKYQSAGKIAEADLNGLLGRWRKVLEKALSRDASRSYDTYQVMLKDVNKALNRNKRLAVASIPLWLILVLIGSFFAYQRYHQHKIMTSEAGQAIERFLNVVNKTSNKFPELERPRSPDSGPDDKTILKPFSKIEPVSEE